MKSAALAALLCVAIPASGQPSAASVGGSVTDQSDAPLSDATITIAHVRNGRSFTVMTGHDGDYRAVALIPGEYDVTAERSGFTSVARRVTLFVGADATVNFALPVAGVDIGTTVVAEVPLVEAVRFQLTSTVTQRQIDALPVLERNVLVLAQLLPGAGPINSTVSRFAVTKFGGAGDQRSAFTTLVDGGDVDDAQWGSPTINVGQDAVQEFTVFRHQFDAQYGHALDAVVAVATRSGTNRLSGSGFYFGRDDALNARNPFAREKSPFDEHRIGGTVGGPIVRGRSHFFGAYERDTTNNSRIIALPPANVLAATENGVFPAKSHDALTTLRFDHRLNARHALSIRYNNENQRSLRSASVVTSDTSQVDTFNRSHSLVVEHTWTPTQHAAANAVRVHLLDHTLGTVARNAITAVSRPAGNIGQTNRDSQVVPRTKLAVSETVSIHTARHEIKFGGEWAFATHDFDSRVFEYGFFQFQTDAPFDEQVPSTWPFAFQQQKPTVFTYRSQELAGFFQDDWRVGDRVWMNAGVRYDIDLNLRLNDFYGRMLDDPSLAGLDSFITRDRGTDTNNFQPRLGATWDARGNGRIIIRGGSGFYVARNRPWYQLRSMNQFGSSVVRITDPTFLRHYPDISAVLGGRSLDSFVSAGGPRQLGTVVPDDFVQPYAVNTTAGAGWQLTNASALDVDYVHSYATHQVGSTDRNLPPTGAVTAANDRPVPQFAQVVMLENFTKSSYDALETQFRGHLRARDSFQVSYTLSRSYLDGVDFFLTSRGTQRTPHERGYNPTDQRHNLTLAASITMPGDLHVSGILKLVSGSPIKVQSGLDLDRDQTATGDLPALIPITVGRERVNESLSAINTFRTTQGLAPIDRSLLMLDPYRSLDVRLTKTIGLGDHRRIELLIEAFNLTNHVNFRPPLGSQPQEGVSLNTASALVRTTARDARQIQWGLRYAF